MKRIFDFFEDADKYFFAGLFNSAMNNFDLSLSELNNRINSNQNNSIEILKNAFSKERTQSDFDNNLKYLSESLIFLNRVIPFISKQEKNIDIRDFLPKFLVSIYHLLNNYRNYYTHYKHKPIEVKDEIIFAFLDYSLFNSANRIKDDRVKHNSVKPRLISKYKDDFIKIIEFKNSKIRKKNIELKKAGKKPHKEISNANKVDGQNFVINDVFRLFLFDRDNQPELTKKSQSRYCDDNTFSSFGFIQILSFFLDKKQINLLFDNVDYTRDFGETDFQKLAARWVFTYNCYKPIRRLFKSEYDKDSLLLQMVSELTKCPKELYPYLSEKDKMEFIEDLNIYMKDEVNFLDDDSLVVHQVITKRYEDKFPYFAIRFLDEFANFPTLRFQVNMGKFNHNTATKKFSSTNLETERRILENITVFEKLSIATHKKTEYFDNNDEDADAKDWVEYPRPSYKSFGNNIGIWLKINDDFGTTDAPDERDNDKPSKKEILNKLKLDYALKKPVAYLSYNELPALLYSLLIKNIRPDEIEKRIKEKIFSQRKNIFEQIKNIKSLTEDEIKKLPNNFRRIVENYDKDVNLKKLKTNLKEEMYFNPLKDIRDKYRTKPKNENILSLSEKGKIATWLSKDIKRFTSKEVKKNWKGYQFSEFQALLSYYDMDRNRIKAFLQEDLVFDMNTDIPFKGINFSNQDFKQFYEYYLKKRYQYLNDLIKNLTNKNIEEQLLIFNKSKFEINSIEKYKQALISNPVMLRRGIFDEKPTAVQKNNKGNVKLAEWFEYSNNMSNAQKFYRYTKYYPINDGITNAIKPDQGIKSQYNSRTKPENQREIYNNEAKIRSSMRKDYYILEMVKTILKDYSQTDTNNLQRLTLNDFYLTKKEKNEYLSKSSTQSSRLQGDTSDFVYNESYILSKPISLELLGGKIRDEVKLKDISKYKKLSQDERVQELTHYSEKVWSILEIENEINDYELIRSKEFFNSVHQLEKEIYQFASDAQETDKIEIKGNPNFKKYLSYYFLNEEDRSAFNNYEIDKIKITDIDEKFKFLFLLTQIRNKFAHNQLIPTISFNCLTKTYPIFKNERVATFLNRVYNMIFNDLKK